ncbi:hypothetical protein [Pseudomonas sp. OTU5201]|uniref:hypothetical protein n=1 Tax=Pseudomonas sp. OTU5201 TaxID=3043850 RepID=UPI00313E8690
MLVPTDTPSVGISLVRADNRVKAPLNEWFRRHGGSYREVVKIPFRADLIWREDSPQVGPLSAAVMVERPHYWLIETAINRN